MYVPIHSDNLDVSNINQICGCVSLVILEETETMPSFFLLVTLALINT